MRRLALLLVLALPPATASADMLPEPEHPSDWSENPPPPPPPPPEKDVTLLFWSSLALVVSGIALLRPRLREAPQ